VAQHPVRHVVHGAVAADGNNAPRSVPGRARGQLDAVPRPFGARDFDRPPLAAELARDRIESPGRRTAARRRIEHDVSVDQRLPL